MGSNSCPIEKLPEDVLLHILQSLPLIDAVTTTPVTRTWNNLWEKSCSQRLNLCFDVENLFGVVNKPISEINKELYPDLTYYRKNLALKDGEYIGMSIEITKDFIEGVNRIVQCRWGEGQDDPLGVKSLEIKFPLRRKHTCHINNWISSTVTSITKQLILIFDIPSDLPSSYTQADFYKFPFRLLLNQKNLSLEHLQLEFISTRLPQKFDGFTTLRTLKLNHTDLTQEDVHKLLINCPRLEFLKIQKCRNLVALQVSSPLPCLKVLILLECHNLRRIELWAENLSSFEYDAAVRMDNLMLRGCHNLTKVVVHSLRDIHGYFRPLCNDFPSVTTLYLESSLNDLSAVLRDNVFSHLKFLAIFMSVKADESNLQYLSSSLNVVAPVLEEFELHVDSFKCSPKCYKISNQRMEGDQYDHLKRVTFTGFTGETGQTMLAKYFLTKARRLQIMTIDPSISSYDNFYLRKCRWGGFPRIIDKRCRKAYKLLCEEVPKNAKLVLVRD